MRIVIDMQGAQSESRFRGIGRYTLCFVQAVSRNCGEHEILLVLNGLLPDSIDAIRAAFDGLIPQRNILVWNAPGPTAFHNPDNALRRAAAGALRESFIACLRPDVVHISSLFEGFVDNAVVTLDNCSQVAQTTITSYDFIPFQNAEQYFDRNPAYERFYKRQLAYLGAARGIFAISQSSKREAREILGVAPEQLVCTYGGVGETFLDKASRPGDVSQLAEQWGIRSDYVLYVGGADSRKNLPRLIEAYAALSKAVRVNHQLVLAGRIVGGELDQLKRVSSAAGLGAGELVFTGYVSDEDLAHLYRRCKLFVFPPWHEGFGLPVIEAMACGAPVIAANASSLPEIVGHREALFDPFDVSSISTLIDRALADEAFRGRLATNATTRARCFTWDESAKRAISAWEQIHSKSRQANGEPAPINWSNVLVGYRKSYGELVGSVGNLIRKQISEPDESAERVLRRLADSIMRNERTILDHWRLAPLPQHLTWRVEGPFDSSYSLALVNRELARGLAELGHDVVLHSTEGPGDYEPDAQFLRHNPDLAEWHRRSWDLPHCDCHVTSRNLYPPRVRDMECSLNMLHSYGWEETGFPSEWVAEFNDSLQGITTMSEHVRKVLIDNGVSVHLSVSGIGVDHWDRVIADTDYGLPATARRFRFLHVSSCFPRKGADVLLHAYGQVFASDDDVSLVIKTFPNPHNEIHRWLEEARAQNNRYPDVQVIEDDLTDAQLKALYQQCHALVAPSRAEGFGLPLAEAMLSGLPVITTAWSGQMDFCNEGNAWLVDYRFEYAQTHFGLFDSVWAEPDVDHLARRLRDVYEAAPEVRSRAAEAGRRLLLDNFRWRHVAERLVSATREFTEDDGGEEPRIGWVSTWNTRCGIASYSLHLIAGMGADVSIFAPAAKPEDLTGPDDDRVVRCWNTGHEDSLEQLEQHVTSEQIDILVIQFNYAFFGFEQFSRLLSTLSHRGCTVVVMMHATTDPSHRPDLRLADLVAGLTRCQRVLVHSPADMNRLKAIGLVDNVSLFPHGIMDFKPALPNLRGPGDPHLICSYGFCLPHKGLLELIEAVAILSRQGVDLRLQMLNAEYPVPESRFLVEQVKKTITDLKLGGIAELYPDYLADHECLERLSRADLIVFPYQQTAESSSAAVRYGIASGAPVAVTPLGVFDDVSPSVLELPGFTPAELARGISNLLRRSTLGEGQRGAVAQRWRSSHAYQHLGTRLKAMLYSLRAARLNERPACHSVRKHWGD